MENTKVISYTAKIKSVPGFHTKGYVLNRFYEEPGKLVDVSNTLLENLSSDGKSIHWKDNVYDKWVKESFKDIEIYYTTDATFDNMVKKNLTMFLPTGTSYKEYKEQKLEEVYTNLLLSEEKIQMRYAVQYCNHENFNIKMIACDLLRHKDLIVFKNKPLLKLMLKGQVDKIEELMR